MFDNNLICWQINELYILQFQRHTRNEKLRTTKLDNPRLREPYLPQPNGDNKLTANMVPGYTGKIIIIISKAYYQETRQ